MISISKSSTKQKMGRVPSRNTVAVLKNGLICVPEPCFDELCTWLLYILLCCFLRLGIVVQRVKTSIAYLPCKFCGWLHPVTGRMRGSEGASGSVYRAVSNDGVSCCGTVGLPETSGPRYTYGSRFALWNTWNQLFFPPFPCGIAASAACFTSCTTCGEDPHTVHARSIAFGLVPMPVGGQYLLAFWLSASACSLRSLCRWTNLLGHCGTKDGH